MSNYIFPTLSILAHLRHDWFQEQPCLSDFPLKPLLLVSVKIYPQGPYFLFDTVNLPEKEVVNRVLTLFGKDIGRVGLIA